MNAPDGYVLAIVGPAMIDGGGPLYTDDDAARAGAGAGVGTGAGTGAFCKN